MVFLKRCLFLSLFTSSNKIVLVEVTGALFGDGVKFARDHGTVGQLPHTPSIMESVQSVPR